MSEPTEYVHGHSPAVLSAHARRTAKVFTPYILPHIEPHHRILDVGCGPGTISADLAALVPEGKVVCFDASQKALDSAREHFATRGLLERAEFVRGEVGDLPFAEGEFDVVHAHQVILHLQEPKKALAEMRRVLRVGGILATKDMIISSMAYYPFLPAMTTWQQALSATMLAAGSDPEMGAKTKALALEVGFARENIKCSVGSWCWATEEDVRWWGQSVAERMSEDSELRKRVVGAAVLTEEQMEEGVRAWREWAESKDAWYGVMNGEVICTK